MADTTPARGMRDILPAEAALRDAVTERILRIYRLYGFDRIETPAIESLARLERSEGGENTKLIFKILKRGEKLSDARSGTEEALADLGLRFDLTVPLARYYAHNRAQLPAVLKAIQIGPVWRAERPQKGRFRQFTQCDIDVLGAASPLVETELLIAGGEALHEVGLGGFVIRVNDRRILAAIARDAGIPDERFGAFCVILDKADKIGMDGVARELRDAGFEGAAIERVGAIFARARDLGGQDSGAFPRALHDPGAVPEEVVRGLALIQSAVARRLEGKGRIEFDATLVRGMGYYTGPIFEVGFRDYPFSIAGGGRYDGMATGPDGSPVPACGLSIGFERVITILQELGSPLGQAARKVAVLVAPATPADAALAAQAAQIRDGVAATLLPRAKNLSHQLDQLKASGFSDFVLVDDAGQAGETKPIAARAGAPKPGR